MLGRLGIRQKLSLLLMIPLAAVVLTMVPFTSERVDDARAAAATARTGFAAREVGALIQTLQEERLISLGYLSLTALDRSALIAQSQTAIDTVSRLEAAAAELDALTRVRQAVVGRAIATMAAYGAFRDASTALLDALRLINPPGVDAQGVGQLAALDALMRSNEDASSVGALLVAMAGQRDISRALLADAITAQEQHVHRFRELVRGEQAKLLDTVEGGQAGARMAALISRVSSPTTPASAELVSETLTAAVSYTGLRRLAQDRAAREIATLAERRATIAQATAVGVTAGAVAVFVIVVALGVTVSRSISRPLRRLTRAAAVVADLAQAELKRVADSDDPTPAPPKLAAVEISSADEIGELAVALNRVQATAALLLERQVTTRRNVAVMFANIARRTQNLVGRQLALVDDLERNERNPELLQRLYRLDHVATRLRRSADSLLVVSGTVDQFMSGAPTPLVDVIRSALAEIEGFRSVVLRDISDVTVSAGLVADLRLLLAELLENATNFSPPGTQVDVTATHDEDCWIEIVDHGLGMSPARLDEENRRLVDRERLDVAPTTVLGLFVVGRLARRHGLTVYLEHSDGRGVTATVRIPARLLSVAAVLPQPVSGVRGRHEPLAIEAAEPSEPFAWFSVPRARVAPPLVVSIADQATSTVSAIGRASVADVDPALAPLPRRTVTATPNAGPASVVQGAQSQAAAPAEGETTDRARVADAQPATRAGLSRRIPGTHMVDAVRDAPDEPTVRISRDPDAEREALNDYLSGLARGTPAAAGPAQQPGPSAPERHA
jgi:signal transduction histidine kinase